MKRFIPIVLALVGAALAMLVSMRGSDAETRVIEVTARQYAFDPPRIHVNQGDEVHIKVHSVDVIHGFYLEGHDINATVSPQKAKITLEHPTLGKAAEEVDEIVFTASRRGKFRYRCSNTCGSMHPFMTGELLVGPNSALHGGLGGIVGLVVGLFLAFGLGRTEDEEKTDAK